MGSLVWVASCASFGQCCYMFAILVVCACAMDPLSVGLLRMSVMCYIYICVARFFIRAYPRPISLVGLCIASIGKLGVSPILFLAALLSSLSIGSSCLSVNVPRWIAWYLDLSSWSIACFF